MTTAAPSKPLSAPQPLKYRRVLLKLSARR